MKKKNNKIKIKTKILCLFFFPFKKYQKSVRKKIFLIIKYLYLFKNSNFYY